MGRRVRELEQAVSQRDGEIAKLLQRADELSAAVERYRQQEAAVALALTRAQAEADKIIREAQEEKDAILLRANADRMEAETEAKGIVADAERRGGIIEQTAREKAHEVVTRAEGFMTQYRANAGKLVAEFKRIAAEASGRVSHFADYMNAMNLDEAVEITREYDHVSAMDQTPAQDMPDDYVDPASLMRSIYAIEHRELPDRQADITKESVPEISGEPMPAIENEPVPEIVPPSEPEAAPAIVPEYEPVFAPEPEKVLNAEQEAAHPADPFTSWVRPQEKADVVSEPQEQASWEKDAVELDRHGEDERVWTVEEIVERTNANGNTQIDDELNAIIEDVLRGS